MRWVSLTKVRKRRILGLKPGSTTTRMMLEVLSQPLNFKFIDHTTSLKKKDGQSSKKIVPPGEFEQLVKKWQRLFRVLVSLS